MSDAWRCFFAVRIPTAPELRELIETLTGLGRDVRAVDPRQLHVTLKFLGPTPVDAIPQLADAAAVTIGDARREKAEVRGLGVFPNLGRPRVLWAGLAGGDLVARLADACERAGEAYGFPREQRVFRPHVTLARLQGRVPEFIRDLVRTHADHVWDTVCLSAVELIRSEPGRAGPTYSTLARIPLED